MGCKQTTTKSPSLVFTASSTTTTTPVYVKSALKKSAVNRKGKSGKLSAIKRQSSSLNKSVNFDEKVRVKLRTPTPKQRRYENASSSSAAPAKIGAKQTPDNSDDDDGQLSSISSQEDIHDEQLKPSIITSTASLQRTQPNGIRHKNNSVAVTPLANNTQEKKQQPSVNTNTYPTDNSDIQEKKQQPLVNTTTYSTDSLNIPTGNRFRVRRKVQQSVLPQTSSAVDPNQSSPTSSHQSTVQTSSFSVPRPLPNTSTVLTEYRAPVPNSGSSPQTAYYAFTRRPIDKTVSTEN